MIRAQINKVVEQERKKAVHGDQHAVEFFADLFCALLQFLMLLDGIDCMHYVYSVLIISETFNYNSFF